MTYQAGRAIIKRLALTTCLIAGCATTQAPTATTVPVPAERVLLKSAGGEATVAITRDAGFLGSACYLAVYVNGALAARMNPSEAVTFSVPAGEVLLGVGYDPQGRGACALTAASTPIHRTIETVVQAGQRKAFRVMSDLYAGPAIARVNR